MRLLHWRNGAREILWAHTCPIIKAFNNPVRQKSKDLDLGSVPWRAEEVPGLWSDQLWSRKQGAFQIPQWHSLTLRTGGWQAHSPQPFKGQAHSARQPGSKGGYERGGLTKQVRQRRLQRKHFQPWLPGPFIFTGLINLQGFNTERQPLVSADMLDTKRGIRGGIYLHKP